MGCTQSRDINRDKNQNKSQYYSFWLPAWLYCNFSRSIENNNICVHVLVCAGMFVFTYSVSWEHREGRGCESCMLGAYSLGHTAHRERGGMQTHRLSWTWSIPASSSQGKLIVVWSTNKSRPKKKNKWTNNHVWLMERWGELALGTYIQFHFAHMQFYLLNEAKSEAGLLTIWNNYQHCFWKAVCV